MYVRKKLYIYIYIYITRLWHGLLFPAQTRNGLPSMFPLYSWPILYTITMYQLINLRS